MDTPPSWERKPEVTDSVFDSSLAGSDPDYDALCTSNVNPEKHAFVDELWSSFSPLADPHFLISRNFHAQDAIPDLVADTGQISRRRRARGM